MSQQIEQFGKYILLEKIASGGMAEVYLARSSGAEGVNKFVAVKRILPQFSDNQEFIDMFREEARIAVNLQNSNIVQIFEFGVEKSQFYLMMEYVEGRNLRQIINEFKKNNMQLSIDQVVFIIKEVAAGLDHAHRCIDGATGLPLNITHRDMSPQNIMVSYEGEVKIIDFGIAKAESQMEATRAGTLKGKFGYMSPEQAEGYNIDLRTDVFSTGIVLWELLANDRLFTASSEQGILRKIRDCQIPSIRKINPSVPPELEKIVNKALAKDRSLRYQTSAALHRDLNRFLNTQFPEFSPHDFSIFIKSAFSQQVQDIKRKLIEYAKLKSQEADLTVITETDVNSTSVTQNDDDPEKQIDGFEELGLNPEHKAQMDLDFNKPNLKKTITKNPISTNRTTSFSPRSKASPIGYQDFSENKSSLPTLLLRISIAGMVLLGAGYFYKNMGSRNLAVDQRGSMPTPLLKSTLPGSKTSGAESVAPSGLKKYTVAIESQPSSAKIIIDDKDTEWYTPWNVLLDKDVVYKIVLRKDGYIPYEARFQARQDPSSLKATMQPLPKTAYLFISARNSGRDPIVTVNGQRLSEKLPIEFYPVPADTPVIVRISNPLLKLAAEQTVTVQPNKRKTVDLLLEPTVK